MNHDDATHDTADERLRTLRDALHEIESEAAHAPRRTDDAALAQHALRTARVLRRRHRTARIALTAACVAVVAGGAVLVANLPQTPVQHPVAVSPPVGVPGSDGRTPACGEPLALAQSIEGLALVSTAFPDAAGRPTTSSAAAQPGERTFADSRALATTMLASIEVTNQSTGTGHEVGGGSGYSQTVLVRDGIVLARTAFEPFSLQGNYVLKPGQTRAAPGLFPAPCPADGSQSDDTAPATDLPEGDYELYAILNPSDDGSTEQAVGGPWDVRIGDSTSASTSTDSLPRCGEAYVAPEPSGHLTLVSAAFEDDDGHGLPRSPAGTAPFATDLAVSVLPVDVRNDGTVRADGTMSTAVSFTIVRDGKVVAAPRAASSPPLLLDLDPGQTAPLSAVAPVPCDGGALADGDYDVYASAGAHLDDDSEPLAVGGPWRIHLGDFPLGDDVPAQVLACGASTTELAASGAPFTLELDQNRDVDPVGGADPMPQALLRGADRSGWALVSAQTAVVRDDVVVATATTDVSGKKARTRFRSPGTIDLDLPVAGCASGPAPTGPVTLVTVVELRPDGGGEPVLVVSNRWETAVP